jgi:hypothetical protein
MKYFDTQKWVVSGRLALDAVSGWSSRRVALAGGVSAAAAVVTGVPTDLIDTPLFGRSVAVTVWAYPIWIVSSLLAGLLVATEIRPGRPLTGGGLLALFAVGCPVCNKPVLILLGSAGATTWFAPLQPILGAAALLVLCGALVRRLRAQGSCRADRPPPKAAASTVA